jgi:prepilin-type N-terminal cleavage/methylation domain-containing protein
MRRRRRGGFTLVEMLVVIGIILVLASILLPVVLSSRRNAMTARIKLDLQTIATGLEEYKKVFGDYPRRANPTDPRLNLLGDYLIGPNGDGVRSLETMDPTKTKGGKKWGPFISPDKFKLEGGRLIDASTVEVQYYPRYGNYDQRPGRSVVTVTAGSTSGFLLGDVTGPGMQAKAMFSRLDGLANDTSDDGKDHLDQTLYMLGDGDDITNGTKADNIINGSERLTFTGPFILVSAGPDGRWGRKQQQKHTLVDDVYNFER